MGAVYLASLLVLLSFVEQSFQDKGSTPRIKEIVIGRCYDYQFKKFGLNTTTWKNCSKIWDALHGGFAFKNPCNLTFADYKPYFDEVEMAEIHNKSLFWSGTYKAVHSYSEFDVRFTTLEDTMAGWIVNELTFCGNGNLSRNTTDGIDYDSCPKWSRSCDYTTPFWGQASKKFAEHARGIVRVMLNGSRVSGDGNHIPAYKRDSFFGKYELPSFQVEKITELMIIVVHTINGTEYEKCGKKSIKLLRDDAKDRGITVSCHDDPDDVRHILCADHPYSRECLFLDEAGYRNRTIIRDICRNPRGLGVSVKASLLLITAGIMAFLFNAGSFK
ncbi:ADP-ribosyl cyclase/cyclic ADP-ribose hydrolase-like [Oculina patagonica]